MRKTQRFLFLATVCTAALFAGCASDYTDDPDAREKVVAAWGMYDPCCDYPDPVIQFCPLGLVFNPIIDLCDWPYNSPSGSVDMFYLCSSCGAVIPFGIGGPLSSGVYDHMYIQDESDNCVATVIMWINHQLGGNITIGEIYRIHPLCEIGIPTWDFYNVINTFFTTEPFTTVQNAIGSGHIIAATINGSSHCVAIVAHYGFQNIYNDPATGASAWTTNMSDFSRGIVVTGIRY